MEAAVSDDLDVVQQELADRPLPIVLDGRRHNYECVRPMFRETVVKEKLLGDQSGNDGLAQTDDIREEETIVLLQETKSAADCVHLVSQPFELPWQIRDGIWIVFDALAEIFDQQFPVQLVRSDFRPEIGGVPDL